MSNELCAKGREQRGSGMGCMESQRSRSRPRFQGNCSHCIPEDGQDLSRWTLLHETDSSGCGVAAGAAWVQLLSCSSLFLSDLSSCSCTTTSSPLLSRYPPTSLLSPSVSPASPSCSPSLTQNRFVPLQGSTPGPSCSSGQGRGSRRPCRAPPAAPLPLPAPRCAPSAPSGSLSPSPRLHQPLPAPLLSSQRDFPMLFTSWVLFLAAFPSSPAPFCILPPHRSLESLARTWLKGGQDFAAPSLQRNPP